MPPREDRPTSRRARNHHDHGVTRRKQHRPGIAPHANTTHVRRKQCSPNETKPYSNPTPLRKNHHDHGDILSVLMLKAYCWLLLLVIKPMVAEVNESQTHSMNEYNYMQEWQTEEPVSCSANFTITPETQLAVSRLHTSFYM